MTAEPDGAPVLVLTNERDFAADLVIRRLHDHGVPVERWNIETHRRVTWRPEGPVATHGCRAVWLRQFLPEPTSADTVAAVDDFLVAREQWRAWLTDLAESPGVRWLNPLWAARRAENKLVQMRVALECGLAVPPTVVTNDRDQAAAHASQVGPCVVKSLASAYFPFSDSAFMFTTALPDALALDASQWSAQPVIVQKAVTGRVDVRVFVLGDFVASTSTSVDDVDWRTSSRDAEWATCAAPAHVVEGCRAYAQRLGISYGAFDFAIDATGNWWFLECNQAGEFAFVDRPLELGVADAVADWLAVSADG